MVKTDRLIDAKYLLLLATEVVVQKEPYGFVGDIQIVVRKDDRVLILSRQEFDVLKKLMSVIEATVDFFDQSTYSVS